MLEGKRGVGRRGGEVEWRKRWPCHFFVERATQVGTECRPGKGMLALLKRELVPATKTDRRSPGARPARGNRQDFDGCSVDEEAGGIPMRYFVDRAEEIGL